MTQKFESRIASTMSELAESCRSLVKRSNTISELAGGEPSLGVYSHQSRVFAMLLSKALDSVESLVETRDERSQHGPSPLAFDNLDLKSTSGSMLSAQKLPCPSGTIDKQPGLKGSTAFLAIPDLIGFLGTLVATGTLEVMTLNECFTIVFDAGGITHAASSSAPTGGRLGDILVEQGALSEMRLSGFLARNRGSNRKLGESLMLEEQVTEKELSAALEEQVRRLFIRLFDADGASFEFTQGACPEEAVAVKMGVPGLLLESAVAIDHSALPSDAQPKHSPLDNHSLFDEQPPQ
jgi:Domain of unknown function (DUF4388)